MDEVRVKSIYRDVARLTTIIEYTDDTKEEYKELDFPQIRNVFIGMKKFTVHAMKEKTPKDSIYYQDSLNIPTFIDTRIMADDTDMTKAKTAVEIAAVTEAIARAKAEADARAGLAGADTNAGLAGAGMRGSKSAGSAEAPSDSQSPSALRARIEALGAGIMPKDAGAWRLDGLGASIRPADMGDWSVHYTDKNAEIDPKAFDKLRANSVYGKSVGTAGHTSAPWDDPLAADLTRAQSTVACMDMPPLRPDYDPNAKVEIYYHDHLPSIAPKELVENAVNILRSKKLNISLHTIFPDKGKGWRLIYKVLSDKYCGPNLKQGKTIDCILPGKCFERFSHDLDKSAKLTAKLDTNTYITLRIAYLLFQGQKLPPMDARGVKLDIFEIIDSTSGPIFDF